MRAILVDDAEAVAVLIRTAFAAPVLPLHPPPSALRVTADEVRAHIAAGGGGCIEPGSGSVLWIEEGGHLHVSRLAVLPQARGCGLAERLLYEAEAVARRHGLPTLSLATRLAGTGTRRLFARLGYIEGALHSHPGFAEPTFVDLHKTLPTGPQRDRHGQAA